MKLLTNTTVQLSLNTVILGYNYLTKKCLKFNCIALIVLEFEN